MIQRLGGAAPPAPGRPPATSDLARPEVDPRAFAAILQALGPGAPAEDPLAEALFRALRLTYLEALGRARLPVAPAPSGTGDPRPLPDRPTVAPARSSPPAAPAIAPARVESSEARLRVESALEPRSAPPTEAARDEDEVIRETARRAGVDPRFLRALRRAENGGPGREFGVLSVPAPTYDDQARVAAETIRRNVERYERTGRPAIDVASGHYTEDFIRFFSSRYAPIGASNDPTGLNRHHARNLVRLYARMARPD